jgi:NAD(P)-dependent dehydrogenase (short-subunit alcohol dehydrogenase family)
MFATQPAAEGLAGRTVVVIGGSAGIGLETARRARADGAEVIITARDVDRLHQAGLELRASIAAFDATNVERLERFFDALPGPIDHVVVAAPLVELDARAARGDVDMQLSLSVQVARNAAPKVRAGGSLLFLCCTGGRRRPAFPSPGSGLAALAKELALEIAPVCVNLIVGSADLAAVAVRAMTDTAVTGATIEAGHPAQIPHAVSMLSDSRTRPGKRDCDR